MDPFDMLNESFNKLSEKVYSILADVAGIKAQQKIIWAVLLLFVSGTVGTLFYIIRKFLEMHLG